MNKDIVLFGATEFEKRLKYYIETFTENRVVAFCVDRDYIIASEFCENPVIALDELPDRYSPENYFALVGIGYKDMNNLRRKKYEQLKLFGYKFYNFVHPKAYIDPSAVLGEGNIIMGNNYIDYKTEIGNGNIIECGNVIAHECKIGDFNYFAPGVSCGGKVIIKNNCFFGLNATIRSAVSIEPYSLIGAGCFISQTTEKYGAYASARSVKLAKKSPEINILYHGEKD